MQTGKKLNELFHSRTVLWIVIVLLAVAMLFNFVQAEQVRSLRRQVSAAYEKAFFETLTLMDGIGSNLEKLMISGSGAMEQQLLSSISRQADAAQDNLSMLPASLPSIEGALKFVNQIGDYTAVLCDRLAAGGAVSNTDKELLLTLHTGSQELSSSLLVLSEEIRQGKDPFTAAADVAQISIPLNVRTQPDIEYPSLLYDGPFSDGRGSTDFRALDSATYTAEQAMELARQFIGEDRVLSVQLIGTGSVPVPCYEITAHIQGGALNLAVTQQGGQVVYMIFDGKPGESRFSQAELIDLASSFLKTRGYPQTAVSYWSYDNALLTVNFAPLQDGVILYPDLIKVEMDASTGLAVGFEAMNYLSNHVFRENLTPTLSAEDAAALLSELFTADSTRLCIIPTDSGEALCYEFGGLAGSQRYLIYLDAHTGQEREIYRIIENSGGQLAI